MRFTHDGQDFMVNFRYEVEQVITDKKLHIGTDIDVDVRETWRRHTVHAVLFRKVDGPRIGGTNKDAPYHWDKQEEGVAECSKVDSYDKYKGRIIALGRLVKRLPKHLKEHVKHAYNTRKDKPMPQVQERPVGSASPEVT